MPVVDAILAALVAWGAFVGFRRGFGEVFWPAVAAVLLSTLGGVTVGHFQSFFIQQGHLGPRGAGLVIYFALVAVVLAVCDQLQLRFGARVATALPAGPWDQGFGAATGAVMSAGFILAGLCVLHPWATARVEWNPNDLHGQHPLGMLLQAVMGSIHQAVIGQSALARVALEHWQPFLLPVAG